MRKYDLIIFDFDGTLADSFAWFGGALHRAAKKYHFKEIKDEDVDLLRGLEPRAIIRHLSISWWKMPFVSRYMRQLMHEEIQTIKPFPGAEDAILALHAEGFKIVIVTSNSLQNVNAVLRPETLKLIDSFECGVSLFGKASRFKKILSRFRVEPERVLSIGDEVRDIDGARGLGIQTAAVVWGYAKEDALRKSNPQFIFRSFEQLVREIHEIDRR